LCIRAKLGLGELRSPGKLKHAPPMLRYSYAMMIALLSMSP
jgi:hypothetical protein